MAGGVTGIPGFKRGKAGVSNKEAMPMARGKKGKRASSMAHRLAKKL